MHNQIKILGSLKLMILSFMLFFGNIAFAATDYKEVSVNSINQLENAVKSVTVPTRITLANGIYTSDATLSGNNTEVIVQAETRGSVIMQKGIHLNGDDIILSGFKFNGGTQSNDNGGWVEVNGDDCHITRCNWDDSKRRKWLRVNEHAYRVEISYNIFQNKYVNQDSGSGDQPFYQVVQTRFDYQDPTPHDHHIHHNHFKNIPNGTNSNSYETVQIYTPQDGEAASVNGADQNTILEYNLFEEASGEGEIISNKANNSIIRYNTFKNCNGMLTLRWGNRSEVYGNSMFGNGSARSGGMAISGAYHKIYNNYIENMGMEGILLREGADGMDGYGTAIGVEISFNTIVNCGNGAIRIGKSTSSPRYAAKNTIISNNILLAGSKRVVQDTSPNANPLDGITFSNNIYYEGSLDSDFPSAGFDYNDPQLTTQANGLRTPTSGASYVVAKASAYTSVVQKDIYQIERPGSRAIGASEVLSDNTNTPIMTASTTGVDTEDIALQPEQPAGGAFIINPGTLR